MPSFSRSFLEWIVDVSEPVTYVAALIAAVAGLAYMLASRPLRRMEADDRRLANERVVNAELRTAELKLQLAQVEARFDDRTLNDEQVENFGVELGTPQCRVVIRSSSEDSETIRFGRVLVKALEAAGWTADHEIMDGPVETKYPLEVTHGGAGYSLCVQRIAGALRRVGMAPSVVNGDPDPLLPRGSAKIRVGKKM